MSSPEFPIAEVAGKSTLTQEQQDRLKGIDWFIEELGVVMVENKTYGILQADWRHKDRFEKWLMT